MSIADILLGLINWIFQRMILPIFPVNLPYLSVYEYVLLLNGTIRHNLIWGLAGLDNFLNLPLLFGFLLIVITAEVLFWLMKAGVSVVKFFRGGG